MGKVEPKILNDFLIYVSTIRGRSKRTRQEYMYDLNLLLRYLKCTYENIDVENIHSAPVSNIDATFLEEISLEDLYSFLEYCKNERGNSSYARARKVASIKSFFKYLTRKRKLLTHDPTDELETPKLGTRSPVYLTLEETKQFLSGIKKDRHYKRNYCLVMFMLNCGLRVSELCSIRLSSIQGDVLRVVGKGNKERTIYLNQVCLHALSEYIEERSLVDNIKDEDALFLSQKGTAINKRTVQRLVKSINEDSNLKKAIIPTATTIAF